MKPRIDQCFRHQVERNDSITVSEENFLLIISKSCRKESCESVITCIGIGECEGTLCVGTLALPITTMKHWRRSGKLLTAHKGMSCVKELLVIAISGLNFRQVTLTVCRSRRGCERKRMAKHEHSSNDGEERR
jgi:hypothetical protein